MKKNLLSIVFALTCFVSNAQWQHTNCTASNGSLLTIHGDTIFQITSGLAVISRSTDNGDSWKKVKDFLTGIAYSIACHGSTVIAYVVPDGPGSTRLFRSTDNGDGWGGATIGINGIPNTIVFSNGVAYAGTSNGGYYSSSDKGDTWNGGAVGSGVQSVTSIFSNSVDVIGTTQGVFLNDIGGWGLMDLRLGNKNITALAGSQLFDLFVGTADSGVFHFGGTPTKQLNNGLDNLHITALTISGSNIFAGTLGGGVFMSTDQGNNWKSINNGLTDMNVMSLVSNGTTLFAGITGNKGVWKRPLADFTGTSVTSVNKNTSISIYPNPSAAIFNLDLKTSSSEKIKISVSNLLGEVIYSSTDEKGNGHLQVNLKNAASGIYFLQVETETGKVLQQKLVKE